MNFLCVAGIALFFLLPAGAVVTPDIKNLDLTKVDWSDISSNQSEEFSALIEIKRVKEQTTWLARAKYFLLNGNVGRARRELSEVDDRTFPKMAAIKDRYASLLAFVEGDYKRSLELLSHGDISSSVNMDKVCLLKMIDLFLLEERLRLSEEAPLCIEAIGDDAPEGLYWFETLTSNDYAKASAKNLTLLRTAAESESVNSIALKMKLALYLGQEKLALWYSRELSPEVFADTQTRELLAFLAWRDNNKKKTTETIKGLETPNADIIRGQMLMNENDTAGALSFFSKAHEFRQTSLVLLARLLPLSWLEKNWDGVLNLLRFVPHTDEEKPLKKALRSATLIQMNEMEAAWKELLPLHTLYLPRPPNEVNIMSATAAFFLGFGAETSHYASFACESGHGAACAVLMEALVWDGYEPLLKNDKMENVSFDLAIDDLRSPAEIDPLKDSVIHDEEEVMKMKLIDEFYPVIKKRGKPPIPQSVILEQTQSL